MADAEIDLLGHGIAFATEGDKQEASVGREGVEG